MRQSGAWRSAASWDSEWAGLNLHLNLAIALNLNLTFLQIFRALMSQFGHETLNVYQKSIRFITWISEVFETISKNLSVHNHRNGI
jgi:hypothetical protein